MMDCGTCQFLNDKYIYCILITICIVYCVGWMIDLFNTHNGIYVELSVFFMQAMERII